jgi:hypothetical protein
MKKATPESGELVCSADNDCTAYVPAKAFSCKDCGGVQIGIAKPRPASVTASNNAPNKSKKAGSTSSNKNSNLAKANGGKNLFNSSSTNNNNSTNNSTPNVNPGSTQFNFAAMTFAQPADDTGSKKKRGDDGDSDETFFPNAPAQQRKKQKVAETEAVFGGQPEAPLQMPEMRGAVDVAKKLLSTMRRDIEGDENLYVAFAFHFFLPPPPFFFFFFFFLLLLF